MNEQRAMPGERFLFSISRLYLFSLIVIWALLWGVGDRASVGVLFLFGPRWIWGVPLLLLPPLCLVFSRRSLPPLVFAFIVFTFPIMQFSIPAHFFLDREATAPRIRVLSFNMGNSNKHNPVDFFALIRREKPDIIALQECRLDETVKEKGLIDSDWHTALGHNNLCLLSRFPIIKVEVYDATKIWKQSGSGLIVRYHLKTDQGPLYVVNLHLETPREGLEGVLFGLRHMASSLWHLRVGEAIQLLKEGRWLNPPEMKDKITMRAYESKVAREWVDQTPHPLIVMGDFNTPADSTLYRQFWSGFDNAYSEAGFGLGYTKKVRWSGIRIDHILFTKKWSALESFVLPQVDGTDHLPIMATLSQRKDHR
ncbi:MAG: endonuclease/exonuclease/phosphatase family protein [Nitrospirota bacterium]|mgnify:CR=1 FL=1